MADRTDSSPAKGQSADIVGAPRSSTHAPRFGGLLHYRPWSGTLRAGDGSGLPLFLAIQTGLFILMGAAEFSRVVGHFLQSIPGDFWPIARMLLCALFVALWGLAVRSRAWPIARISLSMLFRRKLFWAMYALALLVFLFFFFGQYFMIWAQSQISEADVRVGGLGRANPSTLLEFISNTLKLNGSAEMYRNFFWYEGYNVMIVLALAGSILLGNDLRFGSLTFYLAKPVSRWDYLLGKAIAIGVFVNLMTTLPAICLFVQFGLLKPWDEFLERGHLLVGILGYGLVLTATMTLVLLATASWLRRTVPLIMTWTTLFFFCRFLANALVGMDFDARWRLIDLWNSTYLVGNTLLQVEPINIRPLPQPQWQEAALVLVGVCAACVGYLVLRIRAVEIVK